MSGAKRFWAILFCTGMLAATTVRVCTFIKYVKPELWFTEHMIVATMSVFIGTICALALAFMVVHLFNFIDKSSIINQGEPAEYAISAKDVQIIEDNPAEYIPAARYVEASRVSMQQPPAQQVVINQKSGMHGCFSCLIALIVCIALMFVMKIMFATWLAHSILAPLFSILDGVV